MPVPYNNYCIFFNRYLTLTILPNSPTQYFKIFYFLKAEWNRVLK